MDRDTLEVGELLDDTLFGDECGVVETANGAHSQTAILELSKLVLGLGSGVLGEAERVEAEVTRETVTFECFPKGNGAEDLKERDPQKDLPHTASLNEEIMSLSRAHRFNTRETEKFWEDHTKSTEHGNTAMLNLSLLHELEVEHYRQVKGVESNVAGDGLILKRLGDLKEGHGGGSLHGDG